MSYTPSGPYTDNAPPGLTAEALNALELFLQSINTAATDSHISASSGILTILGLIANGSLQVNPTPTVLNGATSGTATLVQPLTGTFKMIFVNEVNFRNATGGSQNITFPVAFTSVAWVICGSSNAFNLLSGGSSVSLQTMNGFGSLSPTSTLGTAALAQAPACDTISFLGGQSSTHTGPVLLFGI